MAFWRRQTPETPFGTISQLGSTLDQSEAIKLYEVFRDYLKHEDALVNNRLTWTLTIQGFLFAAYGLSIQKRLDVLEKLSPNAHDQPSFWIFLTHLSDKFSPARHPGSSLMCSALVEGEVFLISIAILGIVVCVTGFLSIAAARRSSRSLRKLIEAQFSAPKNSSTLHTERVIVVAKKNYIPILLPTVTGGGSLVSEKLGELFSQLVPLTIATIWSYSIFWRFHNLHKLPINFDILEFSFSCTF